MPRFLTRTLTAFAALGILAACSPETVKTPTPTPTHTPSPWPMPTHTTPEPSEPPSEPSPAPTFSESFPPPADDETEEDAAIREGWQNYRIVWDEFLKDPSRGDLTETQYVTTGHESVEILERIDRIRHLGLKMVGDSYFRSVEIGETHTNVDGVRVSIVTSCYDPMYGTSVDAATGEPSEFQADHTSEETVTMELGSDGVWRAALYLNEAEEC